MPLPPRTFSIWKSRRLTVLLVLCDLLGLTACWFGAYFVRVEMERFGFSPINTVQPYLRLFPMLVVTWLLNAAFFGLYMHRRRLTSLNTWRRLLMASYHCLLYSMVLAFLFKQQDLGRSVIVLSGLGVATYFYLSRSLLRQWKAKALISGKGTVRALIVGTGPLALKIRDALRDHREIGFQLAGFVRHPNEPEVDLNGGAPLLGTTDNIVNIIENNGIEEVFLAIANLPQGEQLAILNAAEAPGVNVHLVSNIFSVLTQQAPVEEIGEFPVVSLGDGQLPTHHRIVKEIMDFTLGVVGCLAWLLFFHWWIAARIRASSPGPVFFKQERVGRNGQLFWVYKYRTMVTSAEPYATAPTDPNDNRITEIGKWLRRTSLDELPQLLNVLRGEMSVVGPRPEMKFIVDRYEPWQRRRLDVKPGITGLWQVIGRKNLPLELNMEYDLYYVKNQSLLLDLQILLKTIPAVWTGKGAF